VDGFRLAAVKMRQREAEFEAYVAAARPRLRRLAYSLCGDWHTADDIVQTALAKLYVVWPKVSRASDQDAYVRRTVARTSIDESRRPWRRERSGLEGHDSAMAPTDLAGHHDLVAVLQRLPEMQRKTVVLRHWMGLSVAQTAEDLGITEGTVKSHTSRALATLHDLMTEKEIQP
jgi:RNA polymerase sigma-70 factor (sigma-E family)